MQETDEHKGWRLVCDGVRLNPDCRDLIAWLETILTIVHPCNIFYSSRLANALGNFMELAVLPGLRAAL